MTTSPSGDKTPDIYALHYWPGLPGRGEYVRLAFEATGTPFEDLAFKPGALDTHRPAPLAPPVLVHGEVVLAQLAAILDYLAPQLGLVPDEPRSRSTALMLHLTVGDLLVELHDTHHPLGPQLYYEEQKPEASRRSQGFVERRIPKFTRYFEEVLQGWDFLLGSELSYPDLSLFQTIEGLAFAFPNAWARIVGELPRLAAHRARVAALPRVAAYLASDRRLAFNDKGLFRRYPELDPA